MLQVTCNRNRKWAFLILDGNGAIIAMAWRFYRHKRDAIKAGRRIIGRHASVLGG